MTQLKADLPDHKVFGLAGASYKKKARYCRIEPGLLAVGFSGILNILT